MNSIPLRFTLKSALLTGLSLSTMVLAAPTLSVSLMKVNETTTNGVKTTLLVAADKVIPGDTLLQRATLRTDKVLKNAHITLPVPANTRFVAGSASTFEDITLDYSADHGKTYSVQPMKTVTVTENGKTVKKVVPVPPNDYTTLRWTLAALPAGQVLTVGYRVTVN